MNESVFAKPDHSHLFSPLNFYEMEFSINKDGNHLLVFKSVIDVDNGYTNTALGEFESEMELSISADKNGDMSGYIEWCIDELNKVETIGIWCDKKTLSEYDGVFELPKEAVELLKKAGITVPDEFL